MATHHNVLVSDAIETDASGQPDSRGLLVVLAGLPGTGKTTIARLLARRLQAAYLRTDVIAGPMLAAGLTSDQAEAGRVAYDIAYRIAIENLDVDVPVVVDGVNATHERRALWRKASVATSTRLQQLEMVLADQVEHRQRVEARKARDYLGPTWDQIQDLPYEPWDEAVDGPRLVVDTADRAAALTSCLTYVGSPDAW